MEAMRRCLCFPILILTSLMPSSGQPAGTNYDEAKVPKYTLPDPLTAASGQKVDSARIWREVRRPEILKLYEEQVFGRTVAPFGAKAPKPAVEVLSENTNALGGKAIRREIAVFLKGNSGPKMEILLYLPKSATKPVPVFVGLNFDGNHAASTEPDVRLAHVFKRDRAAGNADKGAQAPESSRGKEASRWQAEMIVSRGYGLATIYYGDIDPDFHDEFQNGVHPLFYKPGQTRPAANEWGSIGAWAWGLSRAYDYLQTDKRVDAKRIAVMGHSRLGKTALWAGAADPRFAMVISNDSGEGGAAIARRQFGERTHNLNRSFPHWFCANFAQYNEKEDSLPVDAHMLIALIAPRPVYIASAEEDKWADPRGEFLAGVAADPVYRLLTKSGLDAKDMPGIHQPVQSGPIGYHIRAGKHDVTAYDWEQFLNFADKHMKAK